MRLQIKDAVSAPGRDVNEDRWGAVEDAVWILDGATGIAERPVLPGPSDALWLVEHVDRGLRERVAGPETPAALLRRIVEAAREDFARVALRPDAPPQDLPSAGFAMIRRRNDQLELANLGDCRILRRDRDGNVNVFGTSKVTALDARLVEEVIRFQRQGLAHDEIWHRVLPMTRRHRGLMNLPEGYWTLDLTDRGLDHIETEIVAARDTEGFLLLSDGFYRLVEVYHRYSYASLFDAALGQGLAQLQDELRAIEAGDPECRAYPRLKPRDDATAVLVAVSEDD